jgi:hypothetical protein
VEYVVKFIYSTPRLRSKVIVDGRQLVEPEKVRKLGFAYKRIGRV